MKIQNTKYKRNSKKQVLMLIGTSLLAIGTVAAVSYYGTRSAPSTNDTGEVTRPINSVDYSAPSDEEKAAGNTQKGANVNQGAIDNQSQETPSDIKNISIIIVDATQYNAVVEVRAYTPDIYEDGGLCSVKYTKSGLADITGTSLGKKDATTTQCSSIGIPRTSFPEPGIWQMTLTYASPTSSGSSKTLDVMIN